MITGNIKLHIKNTVKKTAIGRLLRDKYQRSKSYSVEDAKEVAVKYLGDKIVNYDLNKMASDMLMEQKKHDMSFGEYFMFHFYERSEEERREYVSDLERINFCERMNSMKNMTLFDDKGETYQKFKKYYKRDLIEIFGGGYETFVQFVQKHPRFIVKPFDGACGQGIKIVDSTDRDYKQVFEALKRDYKNGYVAEELIEQSRELGQFHPSSVNTVRVPTILYKDRIEIIHPFFRIGMGGSVVDNGGSGGMINALDPDTGEVLISADQMGNYYTNHPDTGLLLKGFRIPKWNEAKELARELAKVVPDNHYCGWDFVLTDQGWILQEANDRGGFKGFQLQKGFRKELMAILNELGV